MAQTSRAAHWVNEILSGIAAASGVGYLATAYTISRWLTRATPFPTEQPPVDFAAAWENLTCTTADGLQLSGWAVAPPQPRGTIALFHGMRGNRLQMLVRMSFLVREGWRCVAFDHRAHGTSAGKYTSFGWYEARDVAAVADLIARRWPGEAAAALGVSMGAAALCFAAGTAPAFQAFILESVYHDLHSAFHRRIGCGYPSWVARFSRGVVWVTERRMGMDIHAVTPAEYVARMAPSPVLLLTGADDPHATPDDVGRLFDRCADPRELHLIPGAGHIDLDTVGGERYQELVLGFLDRHLRQAQPRRPAIESVAA